MVKKEKHRRRGVEKRNDIENKENTYTYRIWLYSIIRWGSPSTAVALCGPPVRPSLWLSFLHRRSTGAKKHRSWTQLPRKKITSLNHQRIHCNVLGQRIHSMVHVLPVDTLFQPLDSSAKGHRAAAGHAWFFGRRATRAHGHGLDLFFFQRAPWAAQLHEGSPPSPQLFMIFDYLCFM